MESLEIGLQDSITVWTHKYRNNAVYTVLINSTRYYLCEQITYFGKVWQASQSFAAQVGLLPGIDAHRLQGVTLSKLKQAIEQQASPYPGLIARSTLTLWTVGALRKYLSYIGTFPDQDIQDFIRWARTTLLYDQAQDKQSMVAPLPAAMKPEPAAGKTDAQEIARECLKNASKSLADALGSLGVAWVEKRRKVMPKDAAAPQVILSQVVWHKTDKLIRIRMNEALAALIPDWVYVQVGFSMVDGSLILAKGDESGVKVQRAKEAKVCAISLPKAAQARIDEAGYTYAYMSAISPVIAGSPVRAILIPQSKEDKQ